MERCSREQLVTIAEYYELDVGDKRMKENIKAIVKANLFETGVLRPKLQVSGAGLDVSDALLSEVGLTFEQRRELLLLETERERAKTEREKFVMERKRLELEERRLSLGGSETGVSFSPRVSGVFDVVGSLWLVPQFCERDPDIFFSLFERVAESRGWSDSDRTLLLQCVLTGKAQEAYSALTIVESREYATVKAAVLRSYELVPEAYRQRFRTWEKSSRQTHVEFAREQCTHFSRWCSAVKVDTFDALCDLIVLEQFKNSVPSHIAVYISEHKVKTAAEAATLTDEYVLTHRIEREYSGRDSRSDTGLLSTASKWEETRYHGLSRPGRSVQGRVPLDLGKGCHFCKGQGHWKADCPKAGRGKEGVQVRSNVCATSVPYVGPISCQQVEAEVMDGLKDSFSAFLSDGSVSLVGSDSSVPVKILRDTAAFNSYIVSSVLPFSHQSDTGDHVLMRGMSLTVSPVRLHKFVLNCGLVQGEVAMGVRPALPIDGVDIILGNDLAGSRVWAKSSPPPILTSSPLVTGELDEGARVFP